MFQLANQKLLIIAPHPDDEVLGCGGLIKKIKDKGGKVYVLFLTAADTKDLSNKGLSTLKERQREIEDVAKFLKFDDYYLAFPGNDYHLRLDIVGQKRLIDIIERKSPISIKNIKPTMVASPMRLSYNQDHQIAALSSHAALRPASSSNKHFVQTVLSYEMPADTWRLQNQQTPNFFVLLTKKDLEAKLTAIKLYKSQLRPVPNPRALQAVKALAVLRGTQSGHKFAEAFISYRNIVSK